MYLKLHRRDIPLYGFRNLCDQSSLPKKILDCGAGGPTPPLRIFYEHEYECHGIEISKEFLSQAEEYALKNRIYLEIIGGNMLDLPYEDSSFSFVYSHHSLFHLLKVDIKRAIDEMRRVLVPRGLMFLDFPILRSNDLIDGKKIGKGEFGCMHGIEGHIHSYFEDDEADVFFEGMEIIHKMKWEILKSEETIDWFSMIEYVVRKK
jgi:ubiquinone/menaquinone biosynthesis C-methylase UbiE